MTLTLRTSREATQQEVLDLVWGTGALSWPWWQGAHNTGAGIRFLHSTRDDAEGEFSGDTWRSFQMILDAAGKYLSENRGGGDRVDACQESVGYLDAVEADIVLQYAVLGEVFG